MKNLVFHRRSTTEHEKNYEISIKKGYIGANELVLAIILQEKYEKQPLNCREREREKKKRKKKKERKKEKKKKKRKNNSNEKNLIENFLKK